MYRMRRQGDKTYRVNHINGLYISILLGLIACIPSFTWSVRPHTYSVHLRSATETMDRWSMPHVGMSVYTNVFAWLGFVCTVHENIDFWSRSWPHHHYAKVISQHTYNVFSLCGVYIVLQVYFPSKSLREEKPRLTRQTTIKLKKKHEE